MKKLNLLSPISTLGYGIVGANVLRALSGNVDIALFLLGGLEGTPEDIALAQSAMGKADIFSDRTEAPCLKIWHEFSLAERIGKGPLFAFPFFEINKLDERRINHLSSVDGILVASTWAKEIIQKYIEVPLSVDVVPLGVDTSIFTHGPHETTEHCVFLNCGKWEKRKGHDALLEMFRAAFPNETDVRLWMMPSNPFLSEATGFAKVKNEWERYYKNDPRVTLFERVQSHQEVAQIMSSANCGVFPSRAEGWNLELLEMMSLGKPVIATNYSAHTEFCNTNNSMLIEVNDLETAQDGLFFDGLGGEWASLDGAPFQQAVEYLRNFYEEWKINKNQCNEAGINTAKQLSWSKTATRIEEIIYGD